MNKSIGIVFVGFILTACGGGDQGDDTSGVDVANDIAPIASGDWYRPSASESWQWQLQGSLNTGYDVSIYDVDLFDTSSSAITNLQASDVRVICYFSAGSYEQWRDDADQFPASVLGNDLDGWEGERWLDIRSSQVLAIMETRLDLAASKGCDGVEPDNVDGYINNPGFSLTSADQLTYNRKLANAAHERGLAIALKNDLDQVADLVEYYDFAVNEQCFEYNECDLLTPFIEANKPVLHAEYSDILKNNSSARLNFCNSMNALGFSSLVLPLELDHSFRYSCL